MNRRPMSFLVILGLLLTQSASVGHFHEFSLPSDHDQYPHIHASNWLPIACDCHDDSHHEPDHEDDAVYIGADEALVEAGSNATSSSDPSGYLSLQIDVLEVFYGLREPLELWPHPPPNQAAAFGPIYLRFRTLLI